MACIELDQPRPLLRPRPQRAWRLALPSVSRRLLPRLPMVMWIVAVIGLVIPAGGQWAFSGQSPGMAIRHELTQAAAELRSPGPAPREIDQKALLRHFSQQRVSVDTTFWPEAVITLHGLDRATCIDATALAGRIEGLVVVELERYAEAAQCLELNDMSWRIMP